MWITMKHAYGPLGAGREEHLLLVLREVRLGPRAECRRSGPDELSAVLLCACPLREQRPPGLFNG
jgi:hypothetical protein